VRWTPPQITLKAVDPLFFPRTKKGLGSRHPPIEPPPNLKLELSLKILLSPRKNSQTWLVPTSHPKKVNLINDKDNQNESFIKILTH